VFHRYIGIYIQGAKFSAGTRIRYVPAPSQTTPIHTDVTFPDDNTTYFHPFSSNYNNADFTYIEPGIYTWEMTLPGVGCQPVQIQHYFSADALVSPLTYQLIPSCEGMKIKFTGGQLGSKGFSGTVFPSTTYFGIQSVTPHFAFDDTKVFLGDTILLPATGKYVVGMFMSSVGCVMAADTIDYVKPPFTLNNAVTCAYLCQEAAGGGVGFIRVEGMGGSGNYKYQLFALKSDDCQRICCHCYKNELHTIGANYDEDRIEVIPVEWH
jgi:hypothetical protein